MQAGSLQNGLRNGPRGPSNYYMLQNGWDLGDFLQNDPRNRPYMGLEASHFIGEISTGMHSINILKEFERYIMIYPPLQRLFLQGPLKVLDLQGASDII